MQDLKKKMTGRMDGRKDGRKESHCQLENMSVTPLSTKKCINARRTFGWSSEFIRISFIHSFTIMLYSRVILNNSEFKRSRPPFHLQYTYILVSGMNEMVTQHTAPITTQRLIKEKIIKTGGSGFNFAGTEITWAHREAQGLIQLRWMFFPNQRW